MFNPETWDFIHKHAQDDVRKLALKRPDHPNVDLKEALVQIEGYQTARKKLPLWAENPQLVYPPRISMEQCSSETTALYKQQVVRRLLQGLNGPLSMADMAGGFGIDFSYLAPLFDRAYYIEQQEVLCHIARHNLKILGLEQAEVIHGDGVERMPEKAPLTLIFIDPARRDRQGKKTVALSDCTPDLTVLQESIRSCSRFCMAKLSPMLDIHQALQELKGVSEVHVVSVDNECKELLLILTSDREDTAVAQSDVNKAANVGVKWPAETHIHCINLQKGEQQTFEYTAQEEAEAEAEYTDQPGTYLYEPNTSLLKAGAYKCLCARFGVRKLHPNSHLYTSDALRTDFPGRRFRIIGSRSFSKQDLKQIAREIPQANITIRNFPSTVQELRKKLKIKEGGDRYLFITTLKNEQHVILECLKAE